MAPLIAFGAFLIAGMFVYLSGFTISILIVVGLTVVGLIIVGWTRRLGKASPPQPETTPPPGEEAASAEVEDYASGTSSTERLPSPALTIERGYEVPDVGEPDDASGKRAGGWSWGSRQQWKAIILVAFPAMVWQWPDGPWPLLALVPLVLVGMIVETFIHALRKARLPAADATVELAGKAPQQAEPERTGIHEFRLGPIVGEKAVMRWFALWLGGPAAAGLVGMFAGDACRMIAHGESRLHAATLALVALCWMIWVLAPALHGVLSGAVSRITAWGWGMVMVLLVAHSVHCAYFG